MLLVLHLGHWLYWVGVKREFPWPWGAGRERGDAHQYGITFEIV